MSYHDISALRFSIIDRKMRIGHVIPCYRVTLNMSNTPIVLLCRLSTFRIPLKDCSMKTMPITSNIYRIIEFEKEFPT